MSDFIICSKIKVRTSLVENRWSFYVLNYDGIYDGIAYCCHWFPWLEKFTSCWVKYLWLEMVWFPAHEQTQRNNIFLQNYFHNLVSRWTLLSCIRFCYMLSKFMIQILWIHINILYHRKTFFISCKKKFGCIFVVTRK